MEPIRIGQRWAAKPPGKAWVEVIDIADTGMLRVTYANNSEARWLHPDDLRAHFELQLPTTAVAGKTKDDWFDRTGVPRDDLPVCLGVTACGHNWNRTRRHVTLMPELVTCPECMNKQLIRAPWPPPPDFGFSSPQAPQTSAAEKIERTCLALENIARHVVAFDPSLGQMQIDAAVNLLINRLEIAEEQLQAGNDSEEIVRLKDMLGDENHKRLDAEGYAAMLRETIIAVAAWLGPTKCKQFEKLYGRKLS